MNKYLSALPLIVSMMAAPGAFAGERTVTFETIRGSALKYLFIG